MALGDYRFSVEAGGLQKIRRRTRWRWPSQDRIGMAPARQFVGPGEEEISIDVTIFPQYRGGVGQVAQMRAQAGLGVPMILVDGTGVFWGRYVIERVGEERGVFFGNGAPRKIEFDLDLARYA
ncbi:phage tail protein [Amorphus sp. MBR-141]